MRFSKSKIFRCSLKIKLILKKILLFFFSRFSQELKFLSNCQDKSLEPFGLVIKQF